MRKGVLILLAAALCPACARGESAEERQLSQLREGLQRVQQDNDRFEQRLSNVEVQKADEKPATPPGKSDVKTPNLRVVRLAPDGTEQVEASGETASTLNGEDPEDTSPRPSIRVQGVPAPRGKKGASAAGGYQRVEQTMPDEEPNGGGAGPPIKAGAQKPSALDPEAKRAYDSALALVNGKQYARALEAFSAFLVKWPDHPYADNATYWRGECYFAQGEYARASEQFEGLISRFPLGNKVPDALLKLGMSQDKLGNPDKARQAYERLQREFPRSEAVRRIPGRGGDPAPSKREVNR
jgi:tol-pal system protein YbgF